MPERKRPIRKEIHLNEQEPNSICHKMTQLGTRNADDVADLKACQVEIWMLLKESQKENCDHRGIICIWIFRTRKT